MSDQSGRPDPNRVPAPGPRAFRPPQTPAFGSPNAAGSGQEPGPRRTRPPTAEAPLSPGDAVTDQFQAAGFPISDVRRGPMEQERFTSPGVLYVRAHSAPPPTSPPPLGVLARDLAKTSTEVAKRMLMHWQNWLIAAVIPAALAYFLLWLEPSGILSLVVSFVIVAVGTPFYGQLAASQADSSVASRLPSGQAIGASFVSSGVAFIVGFVVYLITSPMIPDVYSGDISVPAFFVALLTAVAASGTYAYLRLAPRLVQEFGMPVEAAVKESVRLCRIDFQSTVVTQLLPTFVIAMPVAWLTVAGATGDWYGYLLGLGVAILGLSLPLIAGVEAVRLRQAFGRIGARQPVVLPSRHQISGAAVKYIAPTVAVFLYPPLTYAANWVATNSSRKGGLAGIVAGADTNAQLGAMAGSFAIQVVAIAMVGFVLVKSRRRDIPESRGLILACFFGALAAQVVASGANYALTGGSMAAMDATVAIPIGDGVATALVVVAWILGHRGPERRALISSLVAPIVGIAAAFLNYSANSQGGGISTMSSSAALSKHIDAWLMTALWHTIGQVVAVVIGAWLAYGLEKLFDPTQNSNAFAATHRSATHDHADDQFQSDEPTTTFPVQQRADRGLPANRPRSQLQGGGPFAPQPPDTRE